jgi:hypothetical protein
MIKSIIMEITADNVPIIRCHITLKWRGNPAIAQIKTITKAIKPTYDCADLSDIHFAIVEKYSMSLSMHMHIDTSVVMMFRVIIPVVIMMPTIVMIKTACQLHNKCKAN